MPPQFEINFYIPTLVNLLVFSVVSIIFLLFAKSFWAARHEGASIATTTRKSLGYKYKLFIGKYTLEQLNNKYGNRYVSVVYVEKNRVIMYVWFGLCSALICIILAFLDIRSV